MISLPSEPKIKNKDEEGKKATFEIESLYPGYGTTIGNSLRRVLLSSLEGTAITQVNMEDVQHEFSTMEGIKEDSLNIILNLKQLNFKVFSDEPQKATLSVSGEKEVKAKDFDFPTQVEVVNGDAPIATLTSEDAELEMEVTIEKGIGFVPAEDRKEGKEKVGQITIDAIFSPVKSVNFNVENMRVGERTDFDKLTIDVETDGSIDPEEAFDEACKILVTHFNLLTGSLDDEEEVEDKNDDEKEEEKEEEPEEKESSDDKDGASLDDLDLSSRVTNILKEEGLTVGDIKKMDESDLKNLSGIGKKSAESILKAVKDN
ncbi:MAG: DNA-directed RNA polymerase subunit alpha [Patescibacteria group bacterium]